MSIRHGRSRWHKDQSLTAYQKATHLAGELTRHQIDKTVFDHFLNTRADTVELMHRVPRELFDAIAEGVAMSLAALFIYIADGVHWWMAHVMEDGRTGPPSYSRDRDSIIAVLGASGDRISGFFSADNGKAMAATYSFSDPDGTVTT